MNAARRYWTLVASLPRLEHFERAERLPLTRLRLEQRLALLHASDARDLAAVEELAGWEHQPLTRTDRQFVERARSVRAAVADGDLADFLDHRMDQRTLVVALRRRRLGLAAPQPGEVWGVGHWSRELLPRWGRTHFGLAHRYPWLPEAEEFLARDDALGLERLLMSEVWSTLERIAERRPFTFSQVFAWVFRWDLVRRWLAHDAEAATLRFRAQVDELLEVL